MQDAADVREAAPIITRSFDLSELRAPRRPGALERSARLEDEVTGLYHRAFFEQRLEAEFAIAQRLGMRLAVFLIDLDSFQHVNDAYGHVTGDALLRAVGEQLREEAAGSGVVARYRDDEFVIIMRGLSVESAGARADRIRARIAPLRVTASIGVSVHTRLSAYDAASDLILAAGDALLASKHGGRNRATVSPGVSTRRIDGSYTMRFGHLRALTRVRLARTRSTQSKPRLGGLAL